MVQINQSRAPVWFFIVSILFLLWNVFGLFVFGLAMFVLNNEEALKGAGLNEAQIALVLSTPNWVNIAFGVAVVFGVLGSIALVAQSKLAIPLLAISLLGVLAQNAHTFFLSDAMRIMGAGASPFVIVGAVAAIPFALYCKKKSWLA